METEPEGTENPPIILLSKPRETTVITGPFLLTVSPYTPHSPPTPHLLLRFRLGETKEVREDGIRGKVEHRETDPRQGR